MVPGLFYHQAKSPMAVLTLNKESLNPISNWQKQEGFLQCKLGLPLLDCRVKDGE